MITQQYNGWTNYETWAVNLWMDNDQGSKDYYLDLATDYYKTDGEYAIYSLPDALKELHEQALPELKGFAADLLGAAMHSVNWREIAEHLISEVKESIAA